jgi:HSP20 family protein
MSDDTKIRKAQGNNPEKLAQRATALPPVDIYENKDELLIVADLPGVAKDDLHIHFDKGQLRLEGGVREFAADEEPFDYRRTFVVPQGIDAEKISAQLLHGVLRVTMPKPAALKPRQIEVKAG